MGLNEKIITGSQAERLTSKGHDVCVMFNGIMHPVTSVEWVMLLKCYRTVTTDIGTIMLSPGRNEYQFYAVE